MPLIDETARGVHSMAAIRTRGPGPGLDKDDHAELYYLLGRLERAKH